MSSLVTVDALAMLPLAVIVGAVALWRRRRPLTRARAMEVALEATLLVMVTIRYGILAVVIPADPQPVLGPDAPVMISGIAAGVCAAVALVGLLALIGGPAWRMTGAVAFLLVTLLEASGNALILDVPVAQRLDTVLSIMLGGGTVVLAALYWTRRKTSPNPLGGDGRPFDY